MDPEPVDGRLFSRLYSGKLRGARRDRVRSLLWQISAQCPEPLAKPVSIRIRGASGNIITLTITSAEPGQVPVIEERLMLSPEEKKIVDVIRSQRRADPQVVLSGKRIAAACKRPYGTVFKVLLANLCERHVLEHERLKGYFIPDSLLGGWVDQGQP